MSISPRQTPASPLRKDIEGLRAVAILAVVLNHMMPTGIKGGFVGVDVFFVISGYLIGMHLLQDLEAGRFSYRRFYARRARRLFPALIVTLLAVWAVGWVVFTVPEFIDLGRHIAAASLFLNNFLLWSQAGYFDAPSISKPLLHLWSLGVEEQFYLLVPFFLWLGWDGHRSSIRWVIRLSFVSLILTVAYPVASFYLLDTRFWELGVGAAIGYLSLRTASPEAGEPEKVRNRKPETAVLACLLLASAILAYSAMAHPWARSVRLASSGLVVLCLSAIIVILCVSVLPLRSAAQRALFAAQPYRRGVQETVAGSGALLIGFSIMALNSTGWPGAQTIFPVLGAALVLVTGPATWVSRLIGCRSLVFVGGISYPLYLWHWPAIVFWRILDFDASSVISIVPVVAAFILAYATKVLVENPIRFGRLGVWKTHRLPLIVVVALLIVVGVIGASTVLRGGYPERLPRSLQAIANLSMPAGFTYWRPHQCFFEPENTGDFAPECTPEKRPGVQRVLVWGDSHAAHLYPGLSDLQNDHEFDIAQWTAGACPPTRTHLAGEDVACEARRVKALDTLPKDPPDTVLLSADWQRYLVDAESEKTMLSAVRDDIRWLQKSGVRRVVLFGPGPIWINSEAAELFAYMLRKRLDQIPERLGKVSDATLRLDLEMADLAATAQVEYISVVDTFCNSRGCLVLGNRNQTPPDLLFRDRDHLTPSGSRLLMDAAARQIFGTR